MATELELLNRAIVLETHNERMEAIGELTIRVKERGISRRCKMLRSVLLRLPAKSTVEQRRAAVRKACVTYELSMEGLML